MGMFLSSSILKMRVTKDNGRANCLAWAGFGHLMMTNLLLAILNVSSILFHLHCNLSNSDIFDSDEDI